MLRKSRCSTSTRNFSYLKPSANGVFTHKKNTFHSSAVVGKSMRADRVAHAFEETSEKKPSIKDKTLHITFVNREGRRHTLPAYEGQTLLDIATNTDVGLEGSCEGGIACTDCHILLPEELRTKVTEPSEPELDIINSLYYVSKQSRLACQIQVDKSMDGAVVALPKSTKAKTIDDYIVQRH